VDIKAIPLTRLETDLKGTLNECADSASILVVELPDHRLIAIQSLEAGEDDDLVNELLASNPAFRQMVAKSKAGPRKPFPPGPGAL
jgi:hypothetical protein